MADGFHSARLPLLCESLKRYVIDHWFTVSFSRWCQRKVYKSIFLELFVNF